MPFNFVSYDLYYSIGNLFSGLVSHVKKIKIRRIGGKKTVFKNNELSSNCNWGKIDKNKRLGKKKERL